MENQAENQGATPSDGNKNAYQLQQQPQPPLQAENVPPPPYFSQPPPPYFSQSIYDTHQMNYNTNNNQSGQPQGYIATPGDYQATHPSFPIEAVNQESARRIAITPCVKVLVTVGGALLLVSLSLYIPGKRFNINRVPNSTEITMSLVFLFMGVVILLIGLIGIVFLCLEKRNQQAGVCENSAPAPVPIYPQPIQVVQGVPGSFAQYQPEPDTRPSLYPRQQCMVEQTIFCSPV